MSYGKKIKMIREEIGWSQAVLAKRIRLPQTSVSNYERSTYPPLEFIIKALAAMRPAMKLYEFFIDYEEAAAQLGISTDSLELAREIEKLPDELKYKFLKYVDSGLEMIAHRAKR